MTTTTKPLSDQARELLTITDMPTEYGAPHAAAQSQLASMGADLARRVLAETRDESHNGWENYPTWAVNMWLSNDRGLYNETLRRIADADTGPSGEMRVYDVAEMLKQWVSDELAPDLGASFAADLLSYALGAVNWVEIATDWIETRP